MKMNNTKLLFALFALVATVFVLAPRIATANEDLADKKDCFSCHSMSERSIGPAYKEVAARYAGRDDAEEKLISKVLKGGTGAWGRNRMPAHKDVSQDEARVLVEWVLSLK